MPTFKFYLKKACVDTLQGADPQALQAKVVQHKANAFSAFGGTGATLASSSAPPASPADARAARLAALAGGSGQGGATTSAAAPAAAGGSSQGGGAEPPSEADVDADALEQLISMGFPRNRSVRALYSVASTGAPPSDLLTFAIEWLSAHAEDPGLDDPVLVSKRQRVEEGEGAPTPTPALAEGDEDLLGLGSPAPAPAPATATEPALTMEEKKAHAKALLEAKRAAAAEAAKADAREAELRRRTQGQGLVKAKEEFEETQRRLLREEQAREKRRAAAERQRLGVDMARDKLERLVQQYGGLANVPADKAKPLQDVIAGVATAVHAKPASVRMDTALGKLAGHRAGGTRALKTLRTLVKNAVEHPEEAKFERINLANRAIKERITSVPGGIMFLVAAGFTRPDGGTDELTLTRDTATLQLALEKLEETLAKVGGA